MAKASSVVRGCSCKANLATHYTDSGLSSFILGCPISNRFRLDVQDVTQTGAFLIATQRVNPGHRGGEVLHDHVAWITGKKRTRLFAKEIFLSTYIFALGIPHRVGKQFLFLPSKLAPLLIVR